MSTRFTIEVEAVPNTVAPAEVRLRRLLKAMLRGYGLRCTAIRPGIPGEPVCSCQIAQDSRSRAETAS